jgi:signal transduction histidine kinase
MSRQATSQDRVAWPGAPFAWAGRGLAACAHGVALGALAMAEVIVVALVALAIAVPVSGVVLVVRQLAELTRRLSARWCCIPIASPYRQPPAYGGLAATDGAGLRWRQRRRWMLTDPATWRDLLWLVVNPIVGVALAGGPAAAIVIGVFGLAVPHGTTQQAFAAQPGQPVQVVTVASPPHHLLEGIALAALGFVAAPWLLRTYGTFNRALLGPSRQAALTQQVQHLSETRSSTIDAGAAEMRRIERDLHDGAQARLIAMGMTLDAAGQLMDSRPDAARALLEEARGSSVRALAELRDLVRGIHPPVLADRGLLDAVHALALDSPLRVSLAGALVGRPPAPVESAAYFAVSELLANVSKHAGARQAWIDIRHPGTEGGMGEGAGGTGGVGGMGEISAGGMLRVSVADDGCGGADPARGSGLSGIERRLAAFDGVLAIRSPPGGPTVVNLEIPCELSSPKTSSF